MKTNFILGRARRRFAMFCMAASLLFPVTALGANVAVDRYELGVNADCVLPLAQTALQYIVDLQLTPDLRHGLSRALVAHD